MQDANEGATHHGKIGVTAHVAGHATQVFEIATEATLLEVMERAATLAGFAVLPPRQRPFDHLHSMIGEQIGPVIDPLDESARALPPPRRPFAALHSRTGTGHSRQQPLGCGHGGRNDPPSYSRVAKNPSRSRAVHAVSA